MRYPPAIYRSENCLFVICRRLAPPGDLFERAKATSAQPAHIVHLAHIDTR
jgi:hypothetical protein